MLPPRWPLWLKRGVLPSPPPRWPRASVPKAPSAGWEVVRALVTTPAPFARSHGEAASHGAALGHCGRELPAADDGQAEDAPVPPSDGLSPSIGRGSQRGAGASGRPSFLTEGGAQGGDAAAHVSGRPPSHGRLGRDDEARAASPDGPLLTEGRAEMTKHAPRLRTAPFLRKAGR